MLSRVGKILQSMTDWKVGREGGRGGRGGREGGEGGKEGGREGGREGRVHSNSEKQLSPLHTSKPVSVLCSQQ